jgi:hypothetical protein
MDDDVAGLRLCRILYETSEIAGHGNLFASFSLSFPTSVTLNQVQGDDNVE